MSADTEIMVRRGVPEDLDTVAALFTEARAAAVPAMPPPVHTSAEYRAWWGRQLEGEREAWVAVEVTDGQEGAPVGVMLLERGWLHSLYVRAGRTGEGIGNLLLDVAQAQRPAGLQLWVFETNTAARRLYERRGFVAVEHTDGSDNEERAPDVRMMWAGDPSRMAVSDLRRRIDDVDDRLAVLLEERALLSAAIQDRKPVAGHAGRDPDREAEIVERMASRAPHLGKDGLARIMHTVITVSLDAAAQPDRASTDRSR